MFFQVDVQNGPVNVQLWQAGEVERVDQGLPLTWVNNTQFLYSKMNPEFSSNPANHLDQLILYDIGTGESTILFDKTPGE